MADDGSMDQLLDEEATAGVERENGDADAYVSGKKVLEDAIEERRNRYLVADLEDQLWDRAEARNDEERKLCQ